MLFTSCRITGKKVILRRINKIEYGRLFYIGGKEGAFSLYRHLLQSAGDTIFWRDCQN